MLWSITPLVPWRRDPWQRYIRLKTPWRRVISFFENRFYDFWGSCTWPLFLKQVTCPSSGPPPAHPFNHNSVTLYASNNTIEIARTHQSRVMEAEDLENKDERDSFTEQPVLPIISEDGHHRQSRRITASMINFSRKGLRKIHRRIRWILGPGVPIPDEKLPKPTSSCSLSYTFGTHSYHLNLDSPFIRITNSFRLKWTLIPFLLLWATANIFLIRQQYYITSTPQMITCDTAVWDDWPPDVCGLNGTTCETQLVGGDYRCMGGCRDVVLGNPRWVGDQVVNKVPLVIGGGDDTHTYRYDIPWLR